MVAPLYDDRGVVRYFIGAQVDVSGLVDEGRGVESFRSLLLKGDSSRLRPMESSEYVPKAHQQYSKDQDALVRLEELTTMFSKDEVEIANKNMRNSDTVSTTSRSTTTNHLGAKRVIGMEETGAFSAGLAQLTLGNLPPTSKSLPGVYQHVRCSIPVVRFDG